MVATMRRFAKKTQTLMSGGPQVSGRHLPNLFIYIQEIRGERQTFENERRRVSARHKRRVRV